MIVLKMLDDLVTDFYNEEQLECVAIVEKDHTKGTHRSNYETLLWAFDELETVNDKEICDLYKVSDVRVLQRVDWITAYIIKTLTKLTGENIEKGFNEAFVLDPSQPEFQYLIRETRKYLETAKAD